MVKYGGREIKKSYREKIKTPRVNVQIVELRLKISILSAFTFI